MLMGGIYFHGRPPACEIHEIKVPTKIYRYMIVCFSKPHSDIIVGIHLEVWKVWTLPFNKFYTETDTFMTYYCKSLSSWWTINHVKHHEVHHVLSCVVNT